MKLKLERHYIWMLVFIILITAFAALGDRHQTTPKDKAGAKLEERFYKNSGDLKKMLRERPRLALALAVAAISGLIVFSVGMVLLLVFFLLWLEGKKLLKPVMEEEKASWELSDAVRIAILFMFSLYSIYIIEPVVFKIAGVKDIDKNLFNVINTTVLDLFALFCVIYFMRVKFKQKLSAIGLSLKGIFKGILTGIVSYVALVPILFFTVLAVIILASLIKYKPPTEPLIELFLNEKRSKLLIYLTLFVSIAGPAIEEVFFRGFLYKALKKKISARWAILVSALLFSTLHTNVVGFFPIFFLGILLAYLYEKTGSLEPSITVHIIHNSSVLAIIFLFKEMMK